MPNTGDHRGHCRPFQLREAGKTPDASVQFQQPVYAQAEQYIQKDGFVIDADIARFDFIEMKIDLAKAWLFEDKLSVREISSRLAFNEPNYFTKTFKRVTGMTPSAYKKRVKQFITEEKQ